MKYTAVLTFLLSLLLLAPANAQDSPEAIAGAKDAVARVRAAFLTKDVEAYADSLTTQTADKLAALSLAFIPLALDEARRNGNPDAPKARRDFDALCDRYGIAPDKKKVKSARAKGKDLPKPPSRAVLIDTLHFIDKWTQKGVFKGDADWGMAPPKPEAFTYTYVSPTVVRIASTTASKDSVPTEARLEDSKWRFHLSFPEDTSRKANNKGDKGKKKKKKMAKNVPATP